MKNKIILVGIALISTLGASDTLHKGAAAQSYGMNAWKQYQCASCHGIKGEKDPAGYGEVTLNSFSKVALEKKMTSLKFKLAYNYNQPAVKIKEHKIIKRFNTRQMDSMARLIGQKKVLNSTNAEKTVETLETPWGTAGQGSGWGGNAIVW